MQKLISFFEGKKTFIVAGITILYALIVTGWQQNNWNEATQLILASLGLASLRHAVK